MPRNSFINTISRLVPKYHDYISRTIQLVYTYDEYFYSHSTSNIKASNCC